MRPDYLVISAWGPYKERVEIDFTKFQGNGLFLITGSTGAGKTTIFDAITYALYGGLSGETREKGSVRSDFAAGETPTFVELSMTHAGKEYRIYRNPEYLRPKKKKSGGSELTKEKENAILYLPDGNVIEGTKEVNAKVQELLVLSQEQFKQISMIAQGQFSKMLTAPAREKIGIFREIFGTGVYERFTKNLRDRATALYVRAAEQKHKLEEDIKLLMESAVASKVEIVQNTGNEAEEKAGYEAENAKYRDRLQSLTESDNWNYEAIRECLADWQKGMKKALADNAKEYGDLDARALSLTEELTKIQEQNRKILQWQAVCVKYDDLLSQREFYEELERKLKNATGAAAVQGKERIWLSYVSQVEKLMRRLELLETEIEELKTEKNGIIKYSENREKLEEFFANCDNLKILAGQEEDAKARFGAKEREYSLAKQDYLKLEADRNQAKADFEQADTKYRHGVIGLAAQMLVPGAPCPVCGSTEHPSPAVAEEGTVSEEQLKEWKDRLEQKEAALLAQQEKTVAFKTQLKSLEEQVELAAEQLKQAEDSIHKQKKGLIGAGFDMDFISVEKVRATVTRYDQVCGLLQSKESEKITALEEEKTVKEQIKIAKKEYETALSQYGFAEEGDFRAALMQEKERAEGEEKCASHKEEFAGTVSLKTHLEQEVKGLKPVDEEATRNALTQVKTNKEEVRLSGERLSSLLDMISGTLSSVKEKQKKLEKISEEYGYVKDLDNLASGNNKKKLVFEQYVLIGYFDEILRAANLRFSHMTGGRYEMSRAEEASDGRTKNSLEIEVMDYYTGKVRSVKTLSGGESFKASLSLALGLSDIIQAMNGGIKVDALFVDEGFGALDSESLDQACEALQSLVEHDRMIGIISHVQELRERLDRQIVVEKSNQGSAVKVRL